PSGQGGGPEALIRGADRGTEAHTVIRADLVRVLLVVQWIAEAENVADRVLFVRAADVLSHICVGMLNQVQCGARRFIALRASGGNHRDGQWDKQKCNPRCHGHFSARIARSVCATSMASPSPTSSECRYGR